MTPKNERTPMHCNSAGTAHVFTQGMNLKQPVLEPQAGMERIVFEFFKILHLSIELPAIMRY
jgi:hypothetical protein